MPLIRPADVLAAMDQPTDLVIDAWGTWLGKRSERLVIRYRLPSEGASDRGRDEVSSGSSAVDRVDRVEASTSVPSAEANLASPGGVVVPSDVAAARSLLRIWRDEAVDRSDWKRPSPHDRLRGQLDAAGAEFDSERSRGGFEEKSVPISRLRSVTISGRGVTLSSDLVEALVEQGVGVSFIGWKGEPIAQLVAPGLSGTVRTRRSQLAAYETELGVTLAVAFVRGKLRNQKHQLQYGGKYLKATAPERFERLTRKIDVLANLRKQLFGFKGDRLDAVRDRLMGHEGTGARVYWEGVAILLEERIPFPGRIGRGAVDPVNSALNYGYSILYGRVSAAIANAGLEQFAGFLHVDRPGKPSLVLDLVEEFRAPIVDRVVLAMVNQGIVLAVDSDGRLTAPVRRQLSDRICERLDTPVPFEGKRYTLGQVIQVQARHLAVAVRGERVYRPFASRW